MKVFNKILIANRGEIAVRIIRTLRHMGISSVAICSEKDSRALYTELADEVFSLPGQNLKDTYLNIDKILEIAILTGADAIHPGYGFLSENSLFSQKTADAGINFIGPPGDVIAMMGDKIQARKLARDAGVPLIPGFEGKPEDFLKEDLSLEFPLIIKAAGGGGGKAMRIVRDVADLHDAVNLTQREAMNYFGKDTLFVEKYVSGGRHIEVQVLVDHYGNILIVGDRECSIQRRYQKIIEESPAVCLNDKTREEMYRTAVLLVKKIGYVNAGTLEFLVDEDQNFYFLEMNTRLQVEHPVTEETTGLDLVEQQIYIAAGNKLSIPPEDIKINGHSIEARIYAEQPEKDFMPSPGTIYHYSEPSLPGIRIDSGVTDLSGVFPDYDPLLAKIIATAPTRDEALDLMRNALTKYQIAGISTNREFLISLVDNQEMKDNQTSVNWLEKRLTLLTSAFNEKKKLVPVEKIVAAWLSRILFPEPMQDNTVWNKIGYWRLFKRKIITYNNQRIEVLVILKEKDRCVFQLGDKEYFLQLHSYSDQKSVFSLNSEHSVATVITGKFDKDVVFMEGFEFFIERGDYLPEEPASEQLQSQASDGKYVIKAPFFGKISKLNVETDSRVKKGDVLFTLDAMKMENKILAPSSGCISDLTIKEGEQIRFNQELMVLNICK